MSALRHLDDGVDERVELILDSGYPVQPLAELGELAHARELRGRVRSVPRVLVPVRPGPALVEDREHELDRFADRDAVAVEDLAAPLLLAVDLEVVRLFDLADREIPSVEHELGVVLGERSVVDADVVADPRPIDVIFL